MRNFIVGIVSILITFGALAYSKADVIKAHIEYVKDKYQAESICYTPIRQFDNTSIHEMHVHTDLVKKLTIFSIADVGGQVTIHESTIPPLSKLDDEVACEYLD